MMAYKITLHIIDHDDIGHDEIISVLQNARYPNHCISPVVCEIKGADIGEWSDDHPLNRAETADKEWARLF